MRNCLTLFAIGNGAKFDLSPVFAPFRMLSKEHKQTNKKEKKYNE